MRAYGYRYDILICLLLTCLAWWGAGRLTRAVLSQSYESYARKQAVPDGEVGGKAGAEVYRAESIQDILSHKYVTIETNWQDEANMTSAGYHEEKAFKSYLLPSGEYIAARINLDAVQYSAEDFKSIMPVGTAVYEDFTGDEDFLNQIESDHPLTRKDIYIDMLGTGGAMSRDKYMGSWPQIAQLITILAFPLFHMLGSGLGLFPYFFKKEEKKSEWE